MRANERLQSAWERIQLEAPDAVLSVKEFCKRYALGRASLYRNRKFIDQYRRWQLDVKLRLPSAEAPAERRKSENRVLRERVADLTKKLFVLQAELSRLTNLPDDGSERTCVDHAGAMAPRTPVSR